MPNRDWGACPRRTLSPEAPVFLKRILPVILLSSLAFAQSNAAHQKYDQALREIDKHNYVKAEKLLNGVIAEAPDWALAYSTMGHLYSLWPRPSVAIIAYEKARDLDLQSHELTPDQRREVNDNLGVIYGLTKQYDKSIAVLESAVKDDPQYGAYEYNLACDYSEKGDLDKALTHLQRAWELRGTFKFPDIMQDDSFKRWHDNPRFQEAAGKMVS